MSLIKPADVQEHRDVAVSTDDVPDNIPVYKQYFCSEAIILTAEDKGFSVKLNWKGRQFQGCLLRSNDNHPWAAHKGSNRKAVKAEQESNDTHSLAAHNRSSREVEKAESEQESSEPKPTKNKSFREKFPQCFVDQFNVIDQKFRFGRDRIAGPSSSSGKSHGQDDSSYSKKIKFKRAEKCTLVGGNKNEKSTLHNENNLVSSDEESIVPSSEKPVEGDESGKSVIHDATNKLVSTDDESIVPSTEKPVPGDESEKSAMPDKTNKLVNTDEESIVSITEKPVPRDEYEKSVMHDHDATNKLVSCDRSVGSRSSSRRNRGQNHLSCCPGCS